jgi:hypothetical protein
VEAWIKAGRPLQLAWQGPHGRRFPTALTIAMDTGQHSLFLLLLCNGYQLNQEPTSPLVLALEARRWDLVDFFWAWGADPLQVSPSTVFETYKSDLFERFYAAGVGFLHDHALGKTLALHGWHKPLFGFAKRHLPTEPRIQVELNIALRAHAYHGNAKGVLLSLWAGADSHAPAPDLDYTDDEELNETAIEAAVMRGHADLLRVLKPDPTRDNFEDLYRWARNRQTVEALATVVPPKNAGPAIRHQLFSLPSRFPYSSHYGEALHALEAVFRVGGRWTQTTVEELKAIRYDLRKATDSEFVDVLKLLTQGEHCNPGVLRDLCRTPTMRQRMNKVGLLPARRKARDTLNVHPEPGWRTRRLLDKVGITLPKPPKDTSISAFIEIGERRWSGTPLRLTREALYERVWAEPVDKLAKPWGLSGRGLAKACKRAGVPVPPRGYWARVQNGQHPRRIPLREVEKGYPVTITVHMPPAGQSALRDAGCPPVRPGCLRVGTSPRPSPNPSLLHPPCRQMETLTAPEVRPTFFVACTASCRRPRTM